MTAAGGRSQRASGAPLDPLLSGARWGKPTGTASNSRRSLTLESVGHQRRGGLLALLSKHKPRSEPDDQQGAEGERNRRDPDADPRADIWKGRHPNRI